MVSMSFINNLQSMKWVLVECPKLPSNKLTHHRYRREDHLPHLDLLRLSVLSQDVVVLSEE